MCIRDSIVAEAIACGLSCGGLAGHVPGQLLEVPLARGVLVICEALAGVAPVPPGSASRVVAHPAEPVPAPGRHLSEQQPPD
eukprot:132226-Lingulodinium_polyedra.AAC.1